MRLNKLTRLFITLTVLILTNTTVSAENKTRIAIMPFKISAIENITHLESTIPNIIKTQLEQHGITTVIENIKQLQPVTRNSKAIDRTRQILVKTGIAALIWGDVEINGEDFTLNINMLNKTEKQAITKITENGKNIETLINTINTAVTKLTSIFLESNIITEILIKGNTRIEDDAIFELIRTKPGDNFKRDKIAKDVKTIYQMECFDNITVERKNGTTGLIISFQIQESPTIKEISFIGHQKFRTKKLQENINIDKGSFFKLSNIHSDIEQIKTMYKEANYHNIQMDYTIEKLDGNQVDLVFTLKEGNRIFIDKICFIGNNTFTSENLKKLIETSEKSKLSWLTTSGKFNKNILLHDENKLFNFYRSKGFINVKIGKTIVRIKDSSYIVTFVIEEGQRFRTGKCTLEGDLIKSEKEMYKNLQAPQYEWFNVQAVQQDVLELTKTYLNSGFANSEIFPETYKNHDGTMDLSYILKGNTKVTIKNIEISGNTVTSDSVIRRVLNIQEGNAYNKDKIGMSLYNIRKLHYFENVTAEQIKYNDIEHVGLNFKVKEKPTGQITFGAGYSSTDKFFVNGSISQENLLGKGQALRLSGTLGSDIDHYNLSFNEPWLFGIPLSGTVRLYKEVDEKIDNPDDDDSEKNKKYKQVDTGLYLGISYPLSDYVRTSLGYRYNVSEDKHDKKDKKNLLQKYRTSSTALTVFYDSRDGSFYTKSGAKHRLTCTYAGLGGNLGFIRLESSFGWHIPVSKRFTLSLRGKYGYIKDLNDPNRYKPLRDRDLFHLGGMDSIRAYNYRTIGIEEIKDEKGNIISTKGGNRYAMFNVELTYPIYNELNLLGVIFYDAGQVFNKNLSELKDGAGCGIRWLSPLGPIRLEAAYKLNNSDKKIKWNFAIGAPF